MPYLYHSFVNPKTDSADTTITRPSNWNARLQYSNDGNTGPGGTDALIREILTANRDYFVRTDGHDTASGLNNTNDATTGAFLTIGKAVGVAEGLIDGGGGWNVNITVEAGTYTENLFLVDLVGAPSVNFTASGTVIIDGQAYVGGGNAYQWHFTGFTFQNSISGSCFDIDGGWVFLENSTWGVVASGNHINVHNFGVAYHLGNETITGGANNHWVCQSGGLVRHRSATITITGTPTFAAAFANADHFGDMQIDNLTFVNAGAVTGNRVNLQAGGRLKTGTQDLVYLPGTNRGNFNGGFYEGIVACCYPITSGPRTITGATDTVSQTDYSLICNRAGTVTLTLPNAPTYLGRWIYVKTITANTVVSVASDVVPLIGGAAGTAILSATAGRWANLQSDGTNWIIMSGVT